MGSSAAHEERLVAGRFEAHVNLGVQRQGRDQGFHVRDGCGRRFARYQQAVDLDAAAVGDDHAVDLIAALDLERAIVATTELGMVQHGQLGQRGHDLGCLFHGIDAQVGAEAMGGVALDRDVVQDFAGDTQGHGHALVRGIGLGQEDGVAAG